MGRTVLASARDRPDVAVACAVNRDPDEDAVEGIAVEPAADLPDLLAERDVNALVDFAGPESSVAYVEACADAGVPAVVGTTGFDQEGEAALRDASERLAVLRAANFSRGVQALLGAVESAVESLPGYDVELTETHHNRKRDAPSGTALTILDRIEAVRDDLDEHAHGRVGEAPRTAGEVGVHARRAGGLHGEHEVLLAGENEAVTLSHRAESRGVFAAGALDAAVWLAGRGPGWYDFSDVVGDSA
jgi:4-hydroxy-tetrahydrodipicolinate reductase